MTLARPINPSAKLDSHPKGRDHSERVTRIPLRILHEDAHQMRKTYNEEYIGLLADTIGVIGLLHPIAVLEEKPKKRYRIIAGHCRNRAFRRLGRKTIPARIFRSLDKETFLSIQISENTYQPVPPHEAAEKYHELYNRLNEKYGKFPLNRLSKVIGRSESALRDAMRFVRLNQKVKEYIKDGILPYGAGVLLSEVDSQEAQNQMAVRAVLTHTKVLVKHMERMIQGYHQSKVQMSMDEMLFTSQKEAELAYQRNLKFFVDRMAHDQMLLAVGYWKNILYLHRKNEGTAYDPLRNRTIRDRFDEMRQLAKQIKSELDSLR